MKRKNKAKRGKIYRKNLRASWGRRAHKRNKIEVMRYNPKLLED